MSVHGQRPPSPVKPWPVILRFWLPNSWSSKIPCPWKQRLWELPLQIWCKTIKTKSKESKLFLYCPFGVGSGSWIYQHLLIQWIPVRFISETQSSYRNCQNVIQVLWGLWWFASVVQSRTAAVHSRLHGTSNVGFCSLAWMWNINHLTSFIIIQHAHSYQLQNLPEYVKCILHWRKSFTTSRKPNTRSILEQVNQVLVSGLIAHRTSRTSQQHSDLIKLGWQMYQMFSENPLIGKQACQNKADVSQLNMLNPPARPTWFARSADFNRMPRMLESVPPIPSLYCTRLGWA